MRLMGYGKGALTVAKPVVPRRAGQWRHFLNAPTPSQPFQPRRIAAG